MSGKRSFLLPVVIFVLGGFVVSGCVTVGEYEKLKEELAQANRTVEQKNQQIEELGAEKGLYQERFVSLEDEADRYRKHSAEADNIINQLRNDLAAAREKAITLKKTDDAKVMDGVELFQPEKGGSAGIRISDEVLFDSGSANIKTGGKTALDWVVTQLLKNNARLEVIGHTDTDPVKRTKKLFPHGNIQLSAMRAILVYEYLKKKGIDEERMSVKGCGPHEPVAPNDTKDNKKKNRRVEILVYSD